MEGKNATKSTMKSNFYQIPIKDCEEDMKRESSKEKKKEILELFTTYNKLRSEEEFNEIKNDLHDACRKGDLEKIKILLSETIENSSSILTFKIDELSQTASLFRISDDIEELIIPRTVEREYKEYLITSIESTKIKIPKYCIYQTFYSNFFSSSKIEKIYFPESLKELRKGLCCGTSNLKKIIISPSNGQFKFIDEKYLISKSDSYNSKNSEFDNLLFVRPDIEEFSIPSNIKIISSFAFFNCKNRTKVEIPTNSNLQTIESYAFSESKIETIFIPPNVSKICEYSFFYCKNLTKVEIPKNSNLQTIESYAFTNSNIESIFIPSKASNIFENAFSNCEHLQIIEISEEYELESLPSSADSIYKLIIMIPLSNGILHHH